MLKRLILLLIVLLFLLTLISLLGKSRAQEGDPALNIPIKTLYAWPDVKSKVVFDIPLEVRILGMMPDRNWYKVKIAFEFPFIPRQEYIGWVYAPIGKVTEKAK